MTPVLNWMKDNVVTVVLIVLMIAAVAVLPMLSGGMNKEIKDEVEARVKKKDDLERLTKTQVNLTNPAITPVSTSTTVNRDLIDRVSRLAGELAGDADAVSQEALDFNQRSHGVITPALYEASDTDWREKHVYDMWDGINARYDALVRRSRAGTPPSPLLVEEALNEHKTAFLANAGVEFTQDLAPDQLIDLRRELTGKRMSLYVDAARSARVYLNDGALGRPYWDGKQELPIGQWFQWQWDLWVLDDLLAALDQAATDDEYVIDAPVKHIHRIWIEPLGGLASASSDDVTSDRGAGKGRFQQPGIGGGRNTGNGTTNAAAVNPGVAVDPTVEAPLDYSRRFTGRITNPLYDVRMATVEMTVDADRLPEVLNALATLNFMTVTDVKMQPDDAFAALQGGFYYGESPVAFVILEIETVWLRQWTRHFMPAAVRQQLNIADAPADNASASAG